MRTSVIISAFILQIFSFTNLYSQTKQINCSDISILQELSVDDKNWFTNHAKEVIEYNKIKNPEFRKRFYCPPTELHFADNCEFPFDYFNVKYYLGMLYYDPKIKLILESNTDNLSLKKNPKITIIRVENAKKIFLFYGITSERIEIIDLKDTWPIDNNKTKVGRENNKYVRMKLSTNEE